MYQYKFGRENRTGSEDRTHKRVIIVFKDGNLDNEVPEN